MAKISENILFLAAGALLGATCYVALKHPDKFKELAGKVLAQTNDSNPVDPVEVDTQPKEGTQQVGEKNE